MEKRGDGASDEVNLGVWLNFRGQIDFFLEIKTSQSSLGVFGEEFGRP
jgi:hypothetical protein